MTLYLLAGGNDRLYHDYGIRFREIVVERVKNPKFLDVFFAVEDSRQEYKLNAWDEWYHSLFGEGITRTLARQDIFLEQISQSDVVYFHGGTTDKLIEAMKRFSVDELKHVFKNKIVVGSSAGAIFLTRMSHSLVANDVRVGSGIIPIDTVVHYGASSHEGKTYTEQDWDQMVRTVREKSNDKYVLLLPEGTLALLAYENNINQRSGA